MPTCVAICLLLSGPLQAATLYLEQNGRPGVFSIEAETGSAFRNSSLGHQWQNLKDTLASTDATIEVLPDRGSRYTSNVESQSAEVGYDIQFKRAGTWYVWVRGRARDSAGGTVHVGLDGRLTNAGRAIQGFPGTALGWSNQTASGSRAQITVNSSGKHRLQLWMDQDGMIVDKLLLVQSAGFVPFGHGPSSNPINSQPAFEKRIDSATFVWDFDDDPQLGRAVDEVRKTALVCSACPRRSQGAVGNAFAFTGAEEFSLQTSLLDAPPGRGLSVETLVNLDSTCTLDQGFLGRHGGDSAMRIGLGCRGGKLVGGLKDSSGMVALELEANAALPVQQWVHIALIVDAHAREARLYQNGIVVATAPWVSISGLKGSAPLRVGKAMPDTAAVGFRGRLDGLGWHHRALQDAEIQRHVKALTTGLKRNFWGCETPVRIMPLGDSITAGTNGDGSKIFGSYRAFLLAQLQSVGYNIDLVGSVYSRLGDADKNHEGWPGVRTDQMAQVITQHLAMNASDLVLVHLGTNGLNLKSMQTTLDRLSASDRSRPAIVARIINRRQFDEATASYNRNLADFVTTRIRSGLRFTLVDMESALNYSTDMLDNLHPNLSGSEKMATVWTESLATLLPRCRGAAPLFMTAALPQLARNAAWRYQPVVLGHPIGQFSRVSGPTGLTVNPETGEVRWTPTRTGTYSFSLRSSNPLGNDEQTYTVVVR